MQTAPSILNTSKNEISRLSIVAIALSVPGICCFPFGLVSIVLGAIALPQTQKNGDHIGTGLSIGGIVLGTLGLLVFLIAMLTRSDSSATTTEIAPPAAKIEAVPQRKAKPSKASQLEATKSEALKSEDSKSETAESKPALSEIPSKVPVVQSPNPSKPATPTKSATAATKKWYQGGTLHSKSALEWQRATREDKLATCGDFVTTMWKNGDLKPALTKKFSTADDVRPLAQELVEFLDTSFKIESDAKENERLYANQTVSSTASIGMVLMGWTK